MNRETDFARNRATEGEIAGHLLLCDATFVPPLSSRVEISAYAHKLSAHAIRFEAWAEGSLVGLVAIYCNDASHRLAYITSVSVLPGSQGSGIASQLLEQCIAYVREAGFESIELEVDNENGKALHMYARHGFIARRKSSRNVIMGLNLKRKL
jgi:ribosomal protein S18 acetylase RimI-like enzyme